MIRIPGIALTISIHTLHTEGDKLAVACTVFPDLFQSTPSTRRVTVLLDQ